MGINGEELKYNNEYVLYQYTTCMIGFNVYEMKIFLLEEKGSPNIFYLDTSSTFIALNSETLFWGSWKFKENKYCKFLCFPFLIETNLDFQSHSLRISMKNLHPFLLLKDHLRYSQINSFIQNYASQLQNICLVCNKRKIENENFFIPCIKMYLCSRECKLKQLKFHKSFCGSKD